MDRDTFVRDSMILSPALSEALNAYSAILSTGYGVIGSRFVDRLKLTVINRMLNGMTIAIGKPNHMDLHRKMKEVHEGKRSTIEIPATLSGYTGALVASWDGDLWTITAHT